jgi:hypothetical protein
MDGVAWARRSWRSPGSGLLPAWPGRPANPGACALSLPRWRERPAGDELRRPSPPLLHGRFNRDGGRDHWLSALIVGGGLVMGQVIGSTDARGEFPNNQPYRIANVLSTLYRTIGIVPATTFRDGTGQPRYRLDEREPVRELL